MPYDFDDSKNAVFNMGIATLMRLNNILEAITRITSNQEYPPEVRQASKIELVKQFFVNACPLLDPTKVKTIQAKYLILKPEVVEVVDKFTGNNMLKKAQFSYELDNQLNELLVELQVELQEEGKYYMPAKRDLSKAVLNM